MSEAEEAAKAIQEASKAAGKAVDAVNNAGGFLSEFLRPPLKEIAGKWTDNLAYRRWENQQGLKLKVFKKIKELGASAPWTPIPLRVGLPLLQAAEVVEEDQLQELWANLLVNFAHSASGVEPQVSFVSIVRELSPLDATILSKIYSLPEIKLGVKTGGLPNQVEHEADPHFNYPTQPPEPEEPSYQVQLSLANLMRLGCISSATVWDGGEHWRVVYHSVLGRALHTACTLQTTRSES